MPEPEVTENYIRIRVKDPNRFQQDSFRTIDISKTEGIKAIIGRLKGETTTTVQSYLFDKEKWTVERAQAWVREHGKKYDYANPEWFEEMNSGGGQMEKIFKNYRAKILNVNEKEHIITAQVTDESKDRQDEIILLSAWKKHLGNYLKHPVLLSSHRYDKLTNQIGEAKSIDLAKSGMIVDFKYYAGEGNPEADWGWNLASKGMAMFSVGFIGHKYFDSSEIGDEATITDAIKTQTPRRVYTEAELLEVSQVLIGANRGALQLGIEPTPELNQYAYEVVKSFGTEIPELVKSVIPFKSYPLAAEGADWDARIISNAADVKDLKIMCTWYDSENPDLESSYKLPHHKASGYNTVWRGVAAAMGVLLGARGGVELPESEKKGIYNHLSKHYAEFGKEAPEFKQYTADELKNWDDEAGNFVIKQADEKIETEGLLLPIKFDLKNISQLGDIVNIIKSGRVLSEKNRSLIKNCISSLSEATKNLSVLLEATEIRPQDENENASEKALITDLLKSVSDIKNRLS